jgi:1-acyl-sn-glycerol-3-phosphate acyltransferase
LFGLFRWYARRYTARHFHAVRISRTGPIPDLPDRPAIIVANHPSWWDAMIPFILTGVMPQGREHFAPIDVVGLAQYPFLARLGFFGVEADTGSGAARFLRTSLAILSRPLALVWITAQGRFVDPRERPTRLRPGMGHLAHRLSDAIVVPMAIEYPFWNDRCPEVLVRFGPMLEVGDGRSRSPADWTAAIERALEVELDMLAGEAMARDPAAFTTILAGTAGVGGVYDRWRRIRARLVGRTFQPEHAARPPAGGRPRPIDRPTQVPDGRNPTA